MSRSAFQSAFKEEMYQYLDYKVASGYKERSYCYHLRQFDKFCLEHGIFQPVFTDQHAAKWIQRKENEASTTHYSRVNGIKHFLFYLHHRGFNVFVTRDINFRQTDFQPHIYTEDEIVRYFYAVELCIPCNRKDAIQLPILFVFYSLWNEELMRHFASENKMWTKDGIIGYMKQKTIVSAILSWAAILPTWYSIMLKNAFTF